MTSDLSNFVTFGTLLVTAVNVCIAWSLWKTNRRQSMNQNYVYVQGLLEGLRDAKNMLRRMKSKAVNYNALSDLEKEQVDSLCRAYDILGHFDRLNVIDPQITVEFYAISLVELYPDYLSRHIEVAREKQGDVHHVHFWEVDQLYERVKKAPEWHPAKTNHKSWPKIRRNRRRTIVSVLLGLILFIFLFLCLRSLNNRTARFQEAVHRPILRVEFKSLSVFGGGQKEAIDSAIITYDLINRGGNTAFDLQLECPRLSPERMLDTCAPRDDLNPSFTSMVVGDTIHRVSRADFVSGTSKTIDPRQPIYAHFCIRYRNLLQNPCRSYSVIALKPQSRGDSLVFRLFDEIQMIEMID
jgi:hypothetical protein